MEKIAREARGRLWFQLYMWNETELSFELVDRARDAGFEALIVTVDSALGSNREYNRRNGFNLPFVPSTRAIVDMLRHPSWLSGVLFRYLLTTGMPRHENYPKKYQHRITTGVGEGKPMRYLSMTWDDIRRLRDRWKGPLIVKGILSPEDAVEAVKHGADGVVISNHGGRAMDSAISPLEILPEIVAACGEKTTILLDGGVRRGSDVVKAVALGATAVLVGRATIYGMAVAGQAGAEHALKIIRSEFEKTMAYTGCRTVPEISSAIFASTILRG
jgi:(S)-mandelate dehydrogenase